MKNYLIILCLVFLSSVTSAQRYSGSDKKEPPLPRPTGIFAGAEGTILNLEDDINASSAAGYRNLLDWLQGRVAGLQVYTTRAGQRIAFLRNSPVTLFVDEMRTDISFLNLLPVNDISFVKIIRQPFVLSGTGGVIAVYTKQGEETEAEDNEEENK